MGTRGYRIIKFRGRYWIFYNHWDSYPTGLGQSLVDSIPTDPEEYQKWLQSQRKFFAKWDSMLQVFLTIQHEDMHKLSGVPYVSIFHAAFDDRLHDDAPPYHVSGFNDLMIEWTYTIDLDQEVFSVDNGAHFRLNRIPQNDEWIKALLVDSKSNRFLLPHIVPANSVATLALNPPSFASATLYETLQTRIVKPKSLDYISPSHLTGQRLRWRLFNFIQSSQQRDLSANLLTWQAQDLPFRELAFFILCLAAGGQYLALVDQRRANDPYGRGLYIGMMTDNEPEDYDELATSLGVGYHMDGLPIGSAPHDTKYWFEGALICLVPRLDYPGIFEKAVVDAIEYGRANCTKSSFNAVLMSIEHLVLIKSLPDGTVDHTELMPLIPINPHMSKDSRARYGDQAIDSFYDAMFSTNKQEVKESDNMDIEQPSQHSDQQDSISDLDCDDSKRSKDQDHEEENREKGSEDDHAEATNDDEEVEKAEDNSETTDNSEDAEMGDEESEDEVAPLQPPASPVTDASIKISFMALIQFFEATTLETLRPTQPNEARLPEEICEMVLRNVSDIKTYNSCLKVSRRFRLLCQRRPLVMDNIVFLEPLREDLDSAIIKSEGGSTHHLPPPDFLAVEVSSDRQMNVRLCSSYGRNNNPSVTCLIVAGHDFNRKTYVINRTIVFSGLRVPAPETDTAHERKAQFRQYEDAERPLHGSEGTPWEGAFGWYGMDTDSETKMLGDFWKTATHALDCSVENTGEPDWTLPPNTTCYFGTQKESFTKSGIDELRFFHYSYLRVRRASKYYDNLWEIIILEATEHLNHTDDQHVKYFKCPEGQVVGADDPYVLLAVGVEVRLFKWEQGFDESVDDDVRRKKSPFSILKELNLGATLNVCEKADREEIERFFDAAKQHREMVKTKESKKCGGKKDGTFCD